MEKIVTYKNANYKVIKVGDNVTVQKEIDGEYTDLTYEELQEFLKYIKNPNQEDVQTNDKLSQIRADIQGKITNGQIKTYDEIEELLKKEDLSEEEIKSLGEELNENLKTELAKDMSVEDINKYADNIRAVLDQHTMGEEILSEFDFENGLLRHSIKVRDMQTGEVRTLSEQSFEFNELIIENLLMVSLKDFSERNESIVNDYEVESNLIESTSNYNFIGDKNCTMTVKNIPINLSEKLKTIATDTKTLTNGDKPGMPQYDEQGNLLGPTNDEEYAQSNYNDIKELDENGMPLTLDEPLKRVRKKPNNQGFMGLKFLIIGLIVLSIGLFLLTKFVLLK